MSASITLYSVMAMLLVMIGIVQFQHNANSQSSLSFVPSLSEPYSYQASKMNRSKKSTPLPLNLVQQIQQEQQSFFVSNKRNSNNNNKDNNELFGQYDPTRPKLEFVHITKNGGTAIERAAGNVGVTWGVCHFEADKYLDICSTNTNTNTNSQQQLYPVPADRWENPKQRKYPSPNFYSGEPWHCPPQWFVPNPYQGTAQFVVIRNPYDRVISEYHCPAWGRDAASLKDTQHFNTWIQYKLEDQTYHGHMIPQWMYVYDMSQRRIMQHVLQYEYIQEEFPQLMKLYKLEHVVLPNKQDRLHVSTTQEQEEQQGQSKKEDESAVTSRITTTDTAQRGTRMTIADMTVETVQMINAYYKKDFELFGYRMIQV